MILCYGLIVGKLSTNPHTRYRKITVILPSLPVYLLTEVPRYYILKLFCQRVGVRK